MRKRLFLSVLGYALSGVMAILPLLGVAAIGNENADEEKASTSAVAEKQLEEGSGSKERADVSVETASKMPVHKPISLNNNSSICFFNSLMQQLYNMETVRDAIINYEVRDVSKEALAKTLQEMLLKIHNASGGISLVDDLFRLFASNKTLYGNLCMFSRGKIARCEDSCEIFMRIIDMLENESPELCKKILSILGTDVQERGLKYTTSVVTICDENISGDFRLVDAGIQRTSEILILQNTNPGDNAIEKFSHNIYVTAGGIDSVYSIIGMAVNISKAHYISYVKNIETGKWYCTNDSQVRETTLEQIVPFLKSNRSTYLPSMLIYKRISAEAKEEGKSIGLIADMSKVKELVSGSVAGLDNTAVEVGKVTERNITIFAKGIVSNAKQKAEDKASELAEIAMSKIRGEIEGRASKISAAKAKAREEAEVKTAEMAAAKARAREEAEDKASELAEIAMSKIRGEIEGRASKISAAKAKAREEAEDKAAEMAVAKARAREEAEDKASELAEIAMSKIRGEIEGRASKISAAKAKAREEAEDKAAKMAAAKARAREEAEDKASELAEIAMSKIRGEIEGRASKISAAKAKAREEAENRAAEMAAAATRAKKEAEERAAKMASSAARAKKEAEERAAKMASAAAKAKKEAENRAAEVAAAAAKARKEAEDKAAEMAAARKEAEDRVSELAATAASKVKQIFTVPATRPSSYVSIFRQGATPQRPFAKKKVYLSPSNQDRSVYAYGDTNEMIQCNKIASYAKVAMERCGFDVNKAPQGQSIIDSVEESNQWEADLHVAIHTSTFNGKVTRGTLVMLFSHRGDDLKAGKAIFDAVKSITPGRNYSMRSTPSLYELRRTKAVAVYVECESHDTVPGAKFIVNNTEQLGEAIAKGVCDYFNITYK